MFNVNTSSGAVQIAGSLDTVSAVGISIGTSTATSITLGSSSITTTVQGAAVFNGSQLTNNGSTLFGTSALGNFATGGVIGTAAATVDVYSSFTVNQTTAGQSLTLPNPTSATAGRLVFVSNIGSQGFAMYGFSVDPGGNGAFVWNGSAWAITGNNMGSSGSYIQNQNSVQQSASNFWISGTGRADTGLQAPLLDTATAVALNIGTTNATAINLNQNTSVSGSHTLTVGTGLTSLGGGLNVTAGATQLSGSLSVTGTSTLTGLLTANGGITVGSAQAFTNGGSTLNSVMALGDLATGPLGTAAATVDVSTAFSINPSAGGRTYSIPSPTSATAGRIIYISNISANSFTIGSNIIGSGNNVGYIWNGTAWAPTGVTGVTTVGTIDSVTKSADGVVINGPNIYLQTADATNVGLVSTGAQTLAGAKTLSGVLTANSGITIATGSTFTNASSTLNTAIALSDFPTGGSIGSAATTVDVATSFTVNQTTAGQTLTIPSPTVTTAGRSVYISNVGTQTFTIGSFTIAPAGTAQFVWNGTAWTLNGNVGSSGAYIQNQNAVQQTASNYWISGTGRADTGFLAPSLDTAAAGTLSIGTTNATTINIGTNNAGHTINIGTGTGVQAVTLGSGNSTSTTTIQGGSGGIGFNISGTQTMSIDSNGRVAIKPLADTSGIFKVLDTSNNQLFTVDADTSKVVSGGSGGLEVLQGGLTVTAGGATINGNTVINSSSTTIGDATTDRLTVTAQLQGGSPLVFQGATDNAFTTTLALTDPTANRTITLPDATGTVLLDSTIGASAIQNQNASAQTTANFWISGTGRADTSFLTPLLDTATAVALNIGTTNATQINLKKNTQIDANLNVVGNTTIANYLTFGAAGAVTTFTTPQGSSVNTRINIPIYDPGNNNQILAFGLPNGASGNSRAISIFDNRALGDSQPVLAVFSPDENSIIGFNWDGGNGTGLVKTNSTSTTNSTGVAIQSGRVTGGTGLTTGNVTIQSGNGAGTNTNSGYVIIDSGTKTGTGTAGPVTIGTTNASAITLGRTGITTTNAGALTVSQTLTASSTVALNGNTTIGDATTDRLTLTAQLQGGSPLVFQGATDNSFTTTFAITDPTANRTITIPDATGTIVLDTTLNTLAIQNQNASAQTTANFWISGTGRADTSFLTPLLDTATAVALNIGTTNATQINLNKTTQITGDLNFANGASRTIRVNNAASGNGNKLTLLSGSGAANSDGGDVQIQAGSSGGGTGGNGGNLLFLGGAANGTNGNGGNITFTAGAKAGAGGSGTIVFKPAASNDNTSAVQFQNAAGNAYLVGDSTNNQIILGKSSSIDGKLVFQNATNTNAITIATSVATAPRTITLPDATGTVLLDSTISAAAIQNQNASAQTTANFWISGTGRADTSFLTPLLDTATAVALNIGTTNATAINLNQNTTIATGKSLTVTAGATSLTGPSGGSSTALTVNTGAASNKGVVITGYASQTANNITVQDNISNVLFSVDAYGNIFGQGITSNDTVTARSYGTSASPLIVVQNAASSTVAVATIQAGATPGANADVLQLKDTGGNINAKFNNLGNQLTLGRISGSGTVTQGKIVLSDGTTSNYGSTLQTTTLTANRTITLPDATGTVLLDSTIGASAIQNQNASAQTTANFWISGTGRADTSFLTPLLDTATAVALNIGTTNATQINLNKNTQVTGNLTFATGANRTISVQTQTTSNTAGNNLTVQSATGNGTGAGGITTLQGGTSGSGATGNGGALNLTGGNAASTNGSGGNVTITAGTKTGSGTGGQVIIKPGTAGDRTDFLSVQNAAAATVLGVNTTNRSVGINTTGSTTYALDIRPQTGMSGIYVRQATATDDIFVARNSANTIDLLRMNASGYLGVQTQTDGAAFGVADSTGAMKFNVDSQYNTVGINYVLPNTADAALTIVNQNSANAALALFAHASQTGNILQVQNSAGTTTYLGTTTTATTLNGNMLFATGANRTIQINTQTTSNTAGNNLTVQSATGNGNGAGGNLQVQAGTGGTTGVGGTLTLQGGSAGGGNLNGGNVYLKGGTQAGSGVKGLVVIDPAAFSSASAQSSAVNVGVTQANVDSYGAVLLNATAAGVTFSLPDPTITTAGRIIYATNTGAYDFTLSVNGGGTGNVITLKPNTTATMYWNGVDWTAAGASSSTDLQAAYNNTATSAGGAELVLNAPGGSADGLTIRNNATTPINGGILEVQSNIGTNLFSVNDLGTELAANGGAETSGTFGTNWTAAPVSATIARTTTAGEFVTGQAGVRVTTTTTANSGVRNNLSGNPVVSTTYTVSFSAKSSLNGTPVDVLYSRDGGTNTVACTSYGTGVSYATLSNTVWTKVTCTITTDGTSPSNPDVIIRKTDTTSPIIYIDNLSFVRNDSTTEPSNVQIGGGVTGGQVTLFTLDRSSSPPVANGNTTYLGSMYYDTTTGRIQCYESDGWGACGSAPDNIITLTPEYTGAVLNGSGVGTMTADFCGNGGGLSINTGFCSSGEARNYYRWTSPQASAQTYSIIVTYKLPSTFKTFADGSTMRLTAYKDHATNGSVTMDVYRKNVGAGTISQCGSNTTITTGTSTWNTTSETGDETGCGFTGGDYIIFKINMTAQSNANVYVENLDFTYMNT